VRGSVEVTPKAPSYGQFDHHLSWWLRREEF
jgi:hypothetical protein